MKINDAHVGLICDNISQAAAISLCVPVVETFAHFCGEI